MAIIYCIVIIVCFSLSSCTRHQSIQKKSDSENILKSYKKDIIDTIVKQEAMLVDIPIPIYDEHIVSDCDMVRSDVLVFAYKSPLSRIQAQEFFMTQMERLGWQHLVSFEAIELILQFASPDRYCTVIIKNIDSQSLSSNIFIYIKKDAT